MTKLRIELNEAGIRQLLQSAEMRAKVEQIGHNVEAAAGDGYEAETRVSGDRVACKVMPSTPHAYYSNLKHNTLQKALWAGGSK